MGCIDSFGNVDIALVEDIEIHEDLAPPGFIDPVFVDVVMKSSREEV